MLGLRRDTSGHEAAANSKRSLVAYVNTPAPSSHLTQLAPRVSYRSDAPAGDRGHALGDQGSTSYLGDCRNENTHTKVALVQSWQRRSPSPDRRMPSRRSESRGSGGSGPCLDKSPLDFGCCSCTEFECGACADPDMRTSGVQLGHERLKRQHGDGHGNSCTLEHRLRQHRCRD